MIPLDGIIRRTFMEGIGSLVDRVQIEAYSLTWLKIVGVDVVGLQVTA